MDTALSRPLILIVEDEGFLLHDAATRFRDDGFDVVEAATGEQAISELSNGYRFDAVFTDINLGGALTGWEIAEACRRRWPDVAVLYASGEAENHSRTVEGSRFFAKPYQIEEIEAACRRLCH